MKTLDFTDLTNTQMVAKIKRFIERLSAYVSFQQQAATYLPIVVNEEWVVSRDYWISRLPEWEERAKNDPSAVSF